MSSNVNYMHIIDHGRKYIEKNYQRPFFDRLMRNALSKILPNVKLFKIMSYLAKIGKPFQFFFTIQNKKYDGFNSLIISKENF